jgi:hypothetical protein
MAALDKPFTSMTAEIIGKNLIITLPMHEAPKASASGKTLVLASSSGNKETDLEFNGKKVTIGVNAYIKKD